MWNKMKIRTVHRMIDHNKVILHEFVQSEITKGSLPLATKIERAAVAKRKPFEFSRFVCFGCT